MATGDYPVCVYCGADNGFQRWHIEMLRHDEQGHLAKYTCYDCGNSVEVEFNLSDLVIEAEIDNG